MTDVGVPSLAVLLPVRDGPYLAQTLDSLRSQTMTDFEVVAVLDGSPDDVDQTLRAARDLHITRVRLPPSGIARALNAGLAACRSEFVARIDADDLCEPSRFETQLKVMLASPELAVLGSGVTCIDETGGRIGERTSSRNGVQLKRELVFRNVFAHPTVMFRLQPILDLGGYDPEAEYFEDYELWLRAATRFDLARSSQPLVRYRIHNGQSSRRLNPNPSQSALLLSRRLELARAMSINALLVETYHKAWATRIRVKASRREAVNP